MTRNNIFSVFVTAFTVLVCFNAFAEEKRNTAQMQAMDKITGHVQIINVPVETEVKYGTLSIVVRDCQTRSPEETPENFAFVDIVDNFSNDNAVNIFRGWMLSSNPAINPVEHPIYDVWLLSCIDTNIDNVKFLSDKELDDRELIKTVQKVNEEQTVSMNFDENIETADDIIDTQVDSPENVIEFSISEDDYVIDGDNNLQQDTDDDEK